MQETIADWIDGNGHYIRPADKMITFRLPSEIYDRIPAGLAPNAGVPSGKSRYMREKLIEAILRDWENLHQVTPSYQPPILAGSPAPIAPRPAPVLPTAAALDGVDVRTAPDRLQAYCDALDARVEKLERAVSNQELRMSLPLHAGRMAEQDRRIEQLERALLDAGHRIAKLEHRIAYLEDVEVTA